MTSEKWLFAFCLISFSGAGVIAWLDGQQGAGYVFFALVGLFLLGFSYQVYRQRTVPEGGPPDPSAQWSRRSRAAHIEQAASFTYSKAALIALRCSVFLSALFLPAIYFLSSPRPTGDDLAGLGVIEVLIVLAVYGAYRACAACSIEVTPDAIRIKGLFRQREFLFSSLGQIALLEAGGRGPRYALALYDKSEKPICKIDTQVEGFEEMVALIKERAFAAGTPYRYRDMWGCWTN